MHCHSARSRGIKILVFASMIKTAYVCILSSKKHGTLYTGVTTNLIRRIYEHKQHLQQDFTRKYNVTRLVWYEQGEDISAAIAQKDQES